MNRRFLAALLFALLLPFAQLAAAAHEVSHLRTADKSTPVSVHCDLCATVAAVTGGAAVSEPPVLVHAPESSRQPAAVAPDAPATRRIPAFLSRAPPFLR